MVFILTMITKVHFSSLTLLRLLVSHITIILPGVFGIKEFCQGSLELMEFNSVRSFCCGGKVYPRFSENYQEQGCCGNAAYILEKQLCCGDRVIDKILPNGRRQECCGTIVYELSPSRICCGIERQNQVLYTNTGFYHPESQRCCLNKVVDISSPQYECCGPHLYNTLNESCCMPGHTVFDKVTNKCCKGSVTDIEKECCGSNSYDKTQQVCCNKKFTVDKQHQHDDKCCYSQHKKIGIPYDSSSQRCITRGREATVEKRVPLCGWKVFNKTSDLCCNMVLVPGGQLQGLDCCTPGRLAFNPEAQICCNSAVYNKTERNSCLNNDNHRNLIKKNLCSICHFIEDKARAKRLSEQIQNLCDKNVIRFIVKKQQVGRHRVKLYGKIKDDRRIKHRHRRRTLVLPCTCSVNTSDVLVVSNKSFKKKHIRLHNLDYIIPYSKKIVWQFRQLFKTMCTIHR